MSHQKRIGRGIVAGVIGGLIASWAMNEFISRPGNKLQQAMSTSRENQRHEPQDESEQQDATMKAADALVSTVTGGHHLTWEEQEKGGPFVHYTFGAAMGGVYGGLAEMLPEVKAGFGTAFASALFAGADLIAVPALGLSPDPTEQSPSALASPLVAHLIYGMTTEFVRRIVRAVL